MLIVRLIALALLLPVVALAQELAPGARYGAAIPTLDQVVGHDHGDELTTPAQVGIYLHALAAAAPDRTHLVECAVH